MARKYSEDDLTSLFDGVLAGTPISELEQKLGRTQGSLVQKLVKLSKRKPETWDIEKIRPYQREYLARLLSSYADRCRAKVLAYLRAHPDATIGEVNGVAHLTFYTAFPRGIAQAREEAGVDRDALLRERKRKEVRTYLRRHKSARYGDVMKERFVGGQQFKRLYPGGIEEARKDAGILGEGDISAAECGRRLGVSREYVSQLVEAKELDGYRVGRWLRIRAESVEARLEQTRSSTA